MKLIKYGKHFIEFIFVLFILVITNLVPFRFLHGYARVLSIILWPILGSGRKRILANLQKNWNWEDNKETRKFIRENIVHQIRVTVEIAQVWKFRSERFMRKHVKFTHFEKRNLDVGQVLVEGHFGNWEIAILIMAHVGDHITFSAKRQSNALTGYIIHSIRRLYRGSILYMDESSGFLRVLRRNGSIGLVADQDGGSDGVFVPFLGREASTYQGPALLAILGKAQLSVVTVSYAGKGIYEFTLEIVHDYSKDPRVKDKTQREQLIQEGTSLWTSALERRIREKPEQYFWMHRRWKTRPEGYREKP